MARLHIGALFLNWIKNLPGSKRCAYNKAIISSPVTLGKLLNETFRVTSQLRRFLHQQRGPGGTRTDPPATTSAGLNCSFTAAASMTPWLQDEDGSLGSPSLNNVSLTCEQDTGLSPPRKVSKVYTNHPSLGSAIRTKILKSFENKQRSMWCLRLGWDMLNDPMQKLWPLDSSLLLMCILSNFFCLLKETYEPQSGGHTD